MWGQERWIEAMHRLDWSPVTGPMQLKHDVTACLIGCVCGFTGERPWGGGILPASRFDARMGAAEQPHCTLTM